MNSGNLVLDKSFAFSLEIIQLYKELLDKREFIISRQILRSGTSIGANISESVSAESDKDFIHKMHISVKEARECYYWLLLLRESKLVVVEIGELLTLADELIRILSSIIKTSKEKKP